jgi:hypothetical protein
MQSLRIDPALFETAELYLLRVMFYHFDGLSVQFVVCLLFFSVASLNRRKKNTRRKGGKVSNFAGKKLKAE